jgi:hypothetical protein
MGRSDGRRSPTRCRSERKETVDEAAAAVAARCRRIDLTAIGPVPPPGMSKKCLSFVENLPDMAGDAL